MALVSMLILCYMMLLTTRRSVLIMGQAISSTMAHPLSFCMIDCFFICSKDEMSVVLEELFGSLIANVSILGALCINKFKKQ